MNKYFGRRGTIFISAFISFITCIWQGLTNTWWHLFIARFILGFGIGPKSATVPVYAAECTPAPIRGALVMMWYVIVFDSPWRGALMFSVQANVDGFRYHAWNGHELGVLQRPRSLWYHRS